VTITWHPCARCKTLLPIDGARKTPLCRCPLCGEAIAAPPGTSGDDAWFYVRDKKKVGPLPFEQLQKLAAVGHLQPLDMVFQGGHRKWTAAKEINNLFPAAPNKPAPPPSATRDTPRQSPPDYGVKPDGTAVYQ
jgi:hypothetical protein